MIHSHRTPAHANVEMESPPSPEVRGHGSSKFPGEASWHIHPQWLKAGTHCQYNSEETGSLLKRVILD